MRKWVEILEISVALAVIGFISATPLESKQFNQKFTTTVHAALDEADEINYRLPNETKPLKYDVHLTTDIHRGILDFTGVVKIEIEVINRTSSIVLHVRQLTIVNVTLYESGSNPLKEIPKLSFGVRDDSEFLQVLVIGELSAGDKVLMVIDYIGQLRDDNKGFYRSSYTDKDGKKVWIASTQFQSTDARHAFPCYDEPQIRTPFVIKIQHDASYNAVSNWPLNTRSPIAVGNYVLSEFQETTPVQTYLIAFVISPFASEENLDARTPQRLFARPDAIEDHEGTVGLYHGVELLEMFKEHFGVPFDPPKMDQVAMPDFDAGAMENWGLVTYREDYLLFNERLSTTKEHEDVLTVISHEFAHMWFGDHVNPIWWDVLWMNEGFATLYEFFMANMLHPDERLMDEYVTNVVQNALEADADPTIRPMTYYVDSPEKIDALFDRVAYDKSGSVLRMMQNIMGDRVWTKGLKYYLDAMSLSPASPADLHAALQTAYDEEFDVPLNISEVMLSWENQAGYPLVTVERNANKLKLTQERFFLDERKSPNLWWIPVNYATQSTSSNFANVSADYWISATKEFELELPNEISEQEWIVVNKQEGFYYRVNYDATLWNAIISQLRDGDREKVHLLSRAQLIDDSLNLARSGKISYRIPFEILEHLVNEDDYIPWAAANRGMTVLNKWLMGTATYANYQSFILHIVTPLFDTFGFDVILGEPKLDRFARQLAINLACTAGHRTCLSSSSQKLDEMFTNGIEILPDVQGSIFCNGLRQANSSMFSRLREKMLNSVRQAERTLLINALGCVESEDLLIEYMSLVINGEAPSLRVQDFSKLLTAPVNSGHVGLRAMLKFVAFNHEKLSSSQVNTILSSIASRISTETLFNELQTLLTQLKLNNGISEGTQNSFLIAARAGLDWQKKYLEEISDWLDEYVGGHNTEGTTDSTSTTTQGSQSVFASTLLIIICTTVVKYLL